VNSFGGRSIWVAIDEGSLKCDSAPNFRFSGFYGGKPPSLKRDLLNVVIPLQRGCGRPAPLHSKSKNDARASRGPSYTAPRLGFPYQ